MSVATCILQGRLGNSFAQISQLFAYARKYNIQYFIPPEAGHYPEGRHPFTYIKNTGERPIDQTPYGEPRKPHTDNYYRLPYYHEIPLMHNPCFKGYWQSYKYFDDYREEVLDLFNLPQSRNKDVVSLSVRRGDFLTQPDAFPLMSMEYHDKAIKYMMNRGWNTFRIFSDDIPWTQVHFTTERYPECIFQFSEGNTPLQDFIDLQNCEHNITTNSTFSHYGAWANRNPDKIVLTPPWNKMFSNCNEDYIPPYFTIIDF